jgi:hypothetical protein
MMTEEGLPGEMTELWFKRIGAGSVNLPWVNLGNGLTFLNSLVCSHVEWVL